MWLKLGEKDKKTWTYWFYARGEGLMDRIEYEEWALKAVVEGQGVAVAKNGEKQERIEVGNCSSSNRVIRRLNELTTTSG